MNAPRAALVLAAVALLAGCSAGGAPQGTAETTATPTTASTTDAETAATATATAAATTVGDADGQSRELPPGVNESGVEDPAALVDAHRSALNESGFGFRFEANVTVGPASQVTVQRGTVEAGLAPLVVNSTSERDLGPEYGTTEVATDLWANETESAVRYDREDRVRVQRYNRSGDGLDVPDETWAHLPRADLESQVTNAWLLELALTAGDYELDRVERRDGREVAVLRATEAAAAANLTDLNATVAVDREGRVHELSLTAAYEGDEPTTRVHYEFELTELGPVAVERPAWVGEAPPPGTATNETETTQA